MLVRAHADTTCMLCNLETGGASPSSIKGSVGVGGANAKADVLTVQQLLNGVTPEDGGPQPLLAEDGIAGPKTNAAIKKFQTRQALKVVDGRVDPNGPTLRKLNDVSTPGQRALAMLRALLGGEVPGNVKNLGGLAQAMRRALRLRRVDLAMPELKSAANAAIRAAEQAMDHLTFGHNPIAFRKAEFYFAFGKQPAARTKDELAFIRTTFNRVKTVLGGRRSVFGGDPFGANIFTIDPLGKVDWRAYSPMQSAENANRKDGVHSGRIYLCDRIDFEVQDLFRHILFHELCHFVDDESKERQIVDAQNGYREGALKLSHQQRMHNSDNYALFASHVAFGRARLVASQPSLATAVPADMA
jgi:peptidoglycan hydrolase-like protein with peptidoglycan-binding domain